MFWDDVLTRTFTFCFASFINGDPFLVSVSNGMFETHAPSTSLSSRSGRTGLSDGFLTESTRSRETWSSLNCVFHGLPLTRPTTRSCTGEQHSLCPARPPLSSQEDLPLSPGCPQQPPSFTGPAPLARSGHQTHSRPSTVCILPQAGRLCLHLHFHIMGRSGVLRLERDMPWGTAPFQALLCGQQTCLRYPSAVGRITGHSR